MAHGQDDDRPIDLPILTSKIYQRNKHRRDAIMSTAKITSTGISDQSVTMPRDPRFDPRCSGSNDRRHFIRNYSFLNEVKQNEISELQKSLRKEQDPEKRDKVKMAIARFRNKMIDTDQKFSVKKTRGKLKKVELAEKFKDLKETGKLTKYLERKRKKLLKRDQKSFQ